MNGVIDGKLRFCSECRIVFTTKLNCYPNFQNHECSEYKKVTQTLDNAIEGTRKPLGAEVYKKNHVKIIKASSKHSYRLVEYMYFMALFMDEPFQRPKPEKFKIFLILTDNTCIGYCAWNYFRQGSASVKEYEVILKLPPALHITPKKEDDSHPMVLRQIFIRPQFQRQGYAKILVEQCLKSLGIKEKWVVEDPNRRFRKWLVKHRYAHVEGNNIIGDKVSFTGMLR